MIFLKLLLLPFDWLLSKKNLARRRKKKKKMVSDKEKLLSFGFFFSEKDFFKVAYF